ncbi:MAG: VanZ family protein [Bacilli bacterium]|nr:VanZ family protein [Bacilli bacterium]MBO6194879.1 VanZ family protein [Bacilli bacterium]
MIEQTMQNALKENWPMILIFTVFAIVARLAYLIVHRERFVLYKELFMFTALLYAMLLFYVVTFQDVNYGTNNFIPFKEILRYEVGSKLFIQNIIGNIIMFIPFGLFVAYLIKTRSAIPTILITIIISATIEYTQMQIGRTFDIDDIFLNLVGGIIGYMIYLIFNVLESHLPPFFSTKLFKNILTIFLLAITLIIYVNSDLWGILR